MITVILLKGHKGESHYDHEDMEAALRRADALVELHGRQHTTYSEVLTPDDGWQVWVDASHYYNNKRCATHSIRYTLPGRCAECHDESVLAALRGE